jgi:hypothetical protein
MSQDILQTATCFLQYNLAVTVQHDDELASSASRFDVYQPQHPYVSLDNYIDGAPWSHCQRRQHGIRFRACKCIQWLLAAMSTSGTGLPTLLQPYARRRDCALNAAYLWCR